MYVVRHFPSSNIQNEVLGRQDDHRAFQGEMFMRTAEKKERPIPQSAALRQRHARTLTAAQGNAPAQLQVFVNRSSRMLAQRKMLKQLFGSPVQRAEDDAPKANHTGLPDKLKSGIESLSGMAMDDVKVHRNSSQPQQLNAAAYAQGNDIHLAPGQEQHLPHEAWHVVQQRQGRVKPTRQMKMGAAVNDDRALEQEADVMGAKAATAGQASSPQNTATAPAQMAGADQVAQCTLLPRDAFEGQFKDAKERQSDVSEYHAQICEDLSLYHANEYDLNDNLWDQIELKHGIRKMALERIILGCNLWLHYPVKQRPKEGNLLPWDTVQTLKADAVAELNKYYKSGHEGHAALHADLEMRAGKKKLEAYSVDAFKDEADLGMVSANLGEMGAVVSKLKAYHAIKEVSGDDSTRVAKLTTLDAISQLAKTAKQSIVDTQKRKSYKEGYPGFWQDWHKSRVQALDKLIEMVKNSRERFVDAVSWRLNLQDARSRNEAAAQGLGVAMSDQEAGWVDVDDGDRSKELEAETDDILKRLAPEKG
jgi:hypothetical protein